MKYMVLALIDATAMIDVDADSPEQAIEVACTTGKMSPRVCHQCSDEIEVGEAWCFRVHNEDGEQVYTDEVPDLRLASDEDLRAELEKRKLDR